MKLSETCIRRPVLAIVLNLLIILVGLVAYDRLTVREYPNIDVPVVTVETAYKGASARIIESQITKPLEDALSGIEGIDFIKSISRAEQSQITVTFNLDREPDSAAADVRDRVGRTVRLLPQEADAPVVSKVEADATPIIWMSLASDRHDAMQVSETADIIVQDRLQTVPGVAQVLLFALRRPAMRVWLDRDRMAAYGLTPGDIEESLRAQNVEIPSGRIESQQREFTVLAETDLRSEDEFRAIIVKQGTDGHLVRLGDLAEVEQAPESERQIARFNNQESVALGVIKQSTANPLEVSAGIQAEIPHINEALPEGMKLAIAYDSSRFIKRSIQSVYTTIGEAVALVVLVIFGFLRSARASFIPLVTIPIALIGACALMYFVGFTMNTLTLLAMVIAIGLVVDDAIVVVENIHRHIEDGMDPLHASVQGMREISFAVVAMTMTLAAVFTPIAFTPGSTGRLFIEFALTLAGAVLVSGFVALTLTPSLAARMLSHHREPGWSRFIGKGLSALDRFYRRVLGVALKGRLIVALAAVGVLAGAGYLFTLLPAELSPAEDRGVIFAIVLAPEGATLDYSDRYVRQVEKIMQSPAEAAWNFVAVGFPFVTQTFSVLGFKPWEERDRNSGQIIQEIGGPLFGVPGVMAFAVNPPSLGQQGLSRPIEFIIQSTGSFEELESIVNKVQTAIRGNPLFGYLDSDLKLNKPQLNVTVDREKIAAIGAEVEDVGRTLETMLGGRRVTRYKRAGEQYDVIVQMARDERRAPGDLQDIFVRAGNGGMVPLSNLVKVDEAVAPRELNHFNKLRAVTLAGNTGPGVTLGQAISELTRITREVAPEAVIDYGGQSREFFRSQSSLALLFGLALLFIFLVLSAQFESFIDPLIILLAVPLAMAGALGTMHLTGGTLNVYSQIGLVALMGLISKHGILIVEFANQLRDQGKPKLEAVLEAASLRLRPILMTTGAMVLGALPLALAHGAGAEGRQAIGWVLVGGLSFGTLMTLFVVPAFYALFSRRGRPVVIDEGKLAVPA